MTKLVRMGQLFSECSFALDEALMPLHYKDLTQRALTRMGLEEHTVDFFRVCEDVREKMLCAGQFGTFYTGAPYFAGCKRDWFRCQQAMLFNCDQIKIPVAQVSLVDANFEGQMRAPYMIQKTNAVREKRVWGLVRGLSLQHPVTDWFANKWPDFYRQADNAGIWRSPCFHDFRLSVAGKSWEVDITGPRSDGSFGNPGNGKRGTDLHLLCSPSDDWEWIIFRGIVTGKEFRAHVLPEKSMTPYRFIVWLNCHHARLDYEGIANA